MKNKLLKSFDRQVFRDGSDHRNESIKLPKTRVTIFCNADAGLVCLMLGGGREISLQGKRDGTACVVVNHLWAWLFNNCKKIFFKTPTANPTVG